MAFRSILFCITESLRGFRRENRANVAITFALATLPIIGCVGAAVDYSHANEVKAALQAALDSTALMLAKDAATLSDNELQTKATSYFNALFTKEEAQNIVVHATYTSTGGSTVQVNGSVDVPTDFLGIIGYNDITVDGSSTTKWGSSRLRVALVLDNTGSMADSGKMTALKTATKSLLTQLQSAASTNGDVYVSIIPFNKDVNVGSTNYNGDWIDWSDWDSTNGRNQSTTTCSSSGSHGHGHSGSSHCTTTTQWVPDDHDTWNGCITDRDKTQVPGTSIDYDQSAQNPDSSLTDSLFPAEQFSSCPVAMMGLNYNWTAMNSLVDTMQSDGNTNQPVGLVWGWQSLVGGGPLVAPLMSTDYQYQKIIILLSDGLNTQDRWYSSQSQVDNRMYDSSGNGTCANIKADGITIYTIQVNTGHDPTSALLKNCASSSDKFFLVTSASGISDVFSSIGSNLTKLRVAK
jgi:Flp pilus assembly protein TadG